MRKPVAKRAAGNLMNIYEMNLKEDVMLNQEFEKEFELIQNYDDFIYNKLIE